MLLAVILKTEMFVSQITVKLLILAAINFHVSPRECQFAAIYFCISMACLISCN